jgi:hypothetical protein
MAVKYVKDFAFDSGFGFTGSSGKTPVRGYMRGGAVKSGGFDNSTRNPMSKFPDIAPAMVGKGPGKMGGKTSDVKPLSKAKANPQIAKYAKGGAVKKAHAKKEMPSFLKGKMMKKADGGSVSEPNDIPFDRSKYNNWWEDPRYTPKPPPDRVPLAGPPTMEEFDRAARTLGRPPVELPSLPPPRIITDIAPPSISEEYDKVPLPEEPVKYVDPYEKSKRDILTGDFIPPRRRPAPLPEEPAKYVDPYEGYARDITGAFLPTRKKPAPRTAEFRDANRNGIDDRDELMQAKRMNERIRAGMKAPRMNRRGMAMIAPEDEQMMGVRMRAPRVPTGIPMYAKGGKVSKGERKIGKVMGEFKRGELHSGSKKGPIVKNPKQATAIALSEARKAGAKIPKRKAMGGKACG